MRYFHRVVTGIDVSPLVDQLRSQPELWEPDPYWIANKQASILYAQDNVVLRYMKAPGHNRPSLEKLPAVRRIILDLMAALEGAVLGNVVISRLRPGEQIASHIDHWPQGIPLLYRRHQVPLSVSPGVVFRCGPERNRMTEEVFMAPGEAWWFNNQVWHEVVNGSSEDRISMFCDIAPL